MNRKQLIGMLREMGVQGVSGESLETLEAILKDENRKRWLKNATLARSQRSGGIVRRRRIGEGPETLDDETGDADLVEGDDPGGAAGEGSLEEMVHVPDGSTEPAMKLGEETAINRPQPPGRKHARETRVTGDDPGRLEALPEPKTEHLPRHEEPIFDRAVDIEKYVSRRAGGCCELCDTPETGQALEFCLFGDPGRGAVKSLKTMAALCPACGEKIRLGILPTDLKKLTRKARGRIISDVPILKKKTPPPQDRSQPGRPGKRKDSRARNKEKRD